MDNYISRQAAIDALRDWEMCYDWDEHCREEPKAPWVVSPSCVINKLPSAQLGMNLAEVGTDCISRQSAIYAFNTNLNELVVGGEENAKTVENYLNRVLDKIKCLPSAQPKRGRWILDRSGAYCCSECMEPCAEYVMMRPRDRYCKMCGAKMEVTE